MKRATKYNDEVIIDIIIEILMIGELTLLIYFLQKNEMMHGTNDIKSLKILVPVPFDNKSR